DRTRSTVPAGASTCRVRATSASPITKSCSCSTTRTARSSARCRTRCRNSPISSPSGAPPWTIARGRRSTRGARTLPTSSYCARRPRADDSYYARMLRANTMSHRDWLGADEDRQRMRLAWAAFFREYDLLLCPVASTVAPPHDQQGERWERMITVDGKRVPTTDQLFWAGYTCAFYLPATAAPVGDSGGLPIGVQITAPQYGDLSAIHFARLLGREYRGFVPPPGYG